MGQSPLHIVSTLLALTKALLRNMDALNAAYFTPRLSEVVLIPDMISDLLSGSTVMLIDQ
jgi:hypothetical protein